MSGSGVVRELNRTRLAEAGYQNASAALTNEQLTRQRVDRLEREWRAQFVRQAILERDFRGRLRWLLTGR